MFMYLASGCTAATKIEKLPMEDNGRIIVEVENEDYALKLKELYPESTPISNRFYTNNIMAGIAGAYNTIAGWTLGDGMFYDEKQDNWVFAPTTDNWKQFVTYARELYASGALDPEFFYTGF